MTQQCVSCGERKPAEAFGTRAGWCWSCDAAYHRARRAGGGQSAADVRREQERDRSRAEIGAAMMRTAAARLLAEPHDGPSFALDEVATALLIDVDDVRDLVEHRRLPRPRRDGGIPVRALLQLLRDDGA